MTRYLLMSESNMYTCSICSKKYKNSRSLASHRYTQHSHSPDGMDKKYIPKCIPTIKGKEGESDLNSNHSPEPHVIESMDEDEPDWSNEKTESELNSPEDESADEYLDDSTSRKRQRRTTSQSKSKRIRRLALGDESTDEHLYDSTSRKRQRRTISQPKAKTLSSKRVRRSTASKIIPKGINLANAEKHVKLIKLLCKAVLNGTIQMQPQQVDILKPHGNFVRNIAEGGIKDGKAIIQKEALASKKTGRSVLKTFLETIIPILPSLFN